MLSAASGAVLVASLGASVLGGLRWLRVAQREHYLPGAVTRFAGRWWRLRALNGALLVAGAFGLALSAWHLLFGLVAACAVAIGPVGLGLRGRTSPLALTRRARSLAALSGVLVALICVLGGLLGDYRGAAIAAAVSCLSIPLIVDLAQWLLAPIERRAAGRYVRAAHGRLAEVAPRVLAITGSYGKTTTKGYCAQLLAGRFTVLASPRSYNNTAGLSRTVNELLVPGTDILVAEMGTYGPGEIAALCAWLEPAVAVITAIGPVHLERFGSLEAIRDAKAEITERAAVSCLNVDEALLAELAQRLIANGRRVRRCSGVDVRADVAVVRCEGEVHLFVDGADLGAVTLPGLTETIALSNVACAVAAAMEFGCGTAEVIESLEKLPVAENRLQVRSTSGGAVVLDDTFNANPAGTRLALSALGAIPARRRVVVTPGMIELGTRQFEENRAFGEAAARVASDIVVVGRTNRRALSAGASAATRAGAAAKLHLVADRAAAVEFVRGAIGSGDAVLYENDLPDHFP